VSGAALTESDAHALQDCLAAGGVAVFPTDTVYGLACDPRSERAVARLYELKGRPLAKPAAVMWFSIAPALQELSDLPPRTRRAAQVLLPGPVTLLLPNPARRFPLACEPAGATLTPPAPLGVRVPAWTGALASLAAVRAPVLQSSANLSGDPAPRAMREVPESIRAGADLVLDGGELPGTASTVIDLREQETSGGWQVLRQGALSQAAVTELLAGIRRLPVK
jgi:L-threonylcarbamoyladenylate synthase